MKLSALIFLASILSISLQVNAQDKWKVADEATVRLKPNVFSQLPKNIVSYLEARDCTVPQSFGASKPQNVIRGQFAKANQFDWAVLCSRKRVSAILIFWYGSTKSVAEIAQADDKDFLQGLSVNEIGFSRVISFVDKDYIIKQYREYGEKKSPPIRHQGINDAFIEKASAVHYFYRKRWLVLQGAD